MLCVPRSWKGLLGSPGTAMGKVNVAKLRYMSRDDFRVLTAVRNSRSPLSPAGARRASCSWKLAGAERAPALERGRGWDWGEDQSRIFQKLLLGCLYRPPDTDSKGPSSDYFLPFCSPGAQSRRHLWPGRWF